MKIKCFCRKLITFLRFIFCCIIFINISFMTKASVSIVHNF